MGVTQLAEACWDILKSLEPSERSQACWYALAVPAGAEAGRFLGLAGQAA